MRWLKLCLLALVASMLTGCATVRVSDSDKRDARLILQKLDPGIRAVYFEQGHQERPNKHSDPSRKTVAVIIREADEARAKAKGSPIEPQVSKLCLALTAYWELPDGKGEKAKAAAAEVEQAKAALQAVAEAK